jgi:hypothetical protein
VRLWELVTGQVVHAFRRPTPFLAVTFTPSGKVLALEVDPEGPPNGPSPYLDLWDVHTGKKLRRFRVAGCAVEGAAFSPSGRWLATAMADTAVLTWDLKRTAREDHPPVRLGAEKLRRLWDDLAGRDAARAYRARRAFWAAPDEAVALVRARLRPATGGRFTRRIADLGAAEFAVREAAFRELARQGFEAEADLRAALRRRQDLEVRRRVERLLTLLQKDSLRLEGLRRARAVQLLEEVGTQAARRQLAVLSRGAPDARLTREAKAALARLAKRP